MKVVKVKIDRDRRRALESGYILCCRQYGECLDFNCAINLEGLAYHAECAAMCHVQVVYVRERGTKWSKERLTAFYAPITAGVLEHERTSFFHQRCGV